MLAASYASSALKSGVLTCLEEIHISILVLPRDSRSFDI